MKTSSPTGARAFVLAAILFSPVVSPSSGRADPPPPDPDADASEADCERARLCHTAPISRAGCFEPDRRCRVFRERHPESAPPEPPPE